MAPTPKIPKTRKLKKVPKTNPPKNCQKLLRPEAEKWHPRQKSLQPEAEKWRQKKNNNNKKLKIVSHENEISRVPPSPVVVDHFSKHHRTCFGAIFF
jgi:hypothetical protein